MIDFYCNIVIIFGSFKKWIFIINHIKYKLKRENDKDFQKIQKIKPYLSYHPYKALIYSVSKLMIIIILLKKQT